MEIIKSIMGGAICITLIICAATMAFHNISGWGWFLFLACLANW